MSCGNDNGIHPILQWETSSLRRGAHVWENSCAMAETLPQRLNRIIKETPGLTMKGLSLKATLGTTAVRDIIVGKSRNPQYSTVKAIADALDMPLTDLLSPDELNHMSKEDAERIGLMKELREILDDCDCDDLRAAIRILGRR